MCFLCCSAQYQDSGGNWVPVAVKCVPYFESLVKGSVKREIGAMKAVKGSDHTATLLDETTAMKGGKPHKYLVMRYGLCWISLARSSKQLLACAGVVASSAHLAMLFANKTTP